MHFFANRKSVLNHWKNLSPKEAIKRLESNKRSLILKG